MAADDRERLFELILAYRASMVVSAMARLDLADHLAEGALDVDELANRAGLPSDTLRRLARGLVNLGLLEGVGDDAVALTAMGALLRSGVPGSLRDPARFAEAVVAWTQIEHALRTGEPGFDAAFGESFFGYLRGHPDTGAAFDGMMAAMSEDVIASAIGAWDFASARRVLDVGGGRGHFVASLLEAHPRLEGAVFDVPEACTAAEREIRSRGLRDRCEVVGGSFFEALPAGYDVHLLKWILHDWGDDHCARILESSRGAIPDDGRLLVVERPLPEPQASRDLHPTIAGDLTMLVNFGAGARERTAEEYEALVGTAGFALEDVRPLASGFALMPCRPV